MLVRLLSIGAKECLHYAPQYYSITETAHYMYIIIFAEKRVTTILIGYKNFQVEYMKTINHHL